MLLMIVLTTLLQVGSQEPKPEAKNVLGGKLESCCMDPLGGFYRDGYCNTGYRDYGVHVVCAVMTKEFLEFTATCGNDLSTPVPKYRFPGLKEGDSWCLCVSRWKEAMEAGKAPPVVLASCHEKALEVVSLEDLQQYEYQP